MPDPLPRLTVEDVGQWRVALVMRRGVTSERLPLGELPAKLRGAFDVAVTLSLAGIPAGRWNDVVTAGLVAIAKDPALRHLLADGGGESVAGEGGIVVAPEAQTEVPGRRVNGPGRDITGGLVR